MTQRAQPGGIRTPGINREWGEVGGQWSDGWIVPAGDPTIAAITADVDESEFDAFDASYSSTSLSVEIQPGEAFVNGWIAMDEPESVVLDTNETQTVYLGWNHNAVEEDELIIGLDDAFDGTREYAPRVPIWTFETDGDGVIDATDERDIGPTAIVDKLTVNESADIPEDDMSDGGFKEDWGYIDAGEYGYPGDGSGGDIFDLVRDHPDKFIILPEGEYSVESELELENWDEEDHPYPAIIGKHHATLKIQSTDVDRMIRAGQASNPIPRIRLEDLTLDLTADENYDAGWGRFYVSESAVCRNLSIKGRRSYNENSGDKFSYYCDMTEPEALGFHENIRFPDGDEWAGSDDAAHAIAIGSDPNHVGTNIWMGCYVNEYWDNGFYVKGSEGPNILIGCTARNCGRSNVRLGKQDMAIGLQSLWDMDPDAEHYPEGDDGEPDGFGNLLSSDEAEGTTVRGAKLVNETGGNDCLRTWLGTGQGSFADITIVNETDQWSIRTSANDDHQDTLDDSIGEDSVATFQGITILEDSDTSIRGGAVVSERDHAVFRDITYKNDNADNTDRDFLVLDASGSASIYDSSIECPTGRFVRVRGDEGVLRVEGSTFNGGVDIDGSLEAAHIVGNDMRDVPDPFNGTDGASTIGDLTFLANLGYIDQTQYGELSTNELHTHNITMPAGHSMIDITAPEEATEWMQIRGWETSNHVLKWGYEGFEGYYWQIDGDDNSFLFRDQNDNTIVEIDTSVNEVLVNGEWTVTSGETTYSIEKDGSDASGVINFKTN